VQLGTFRAREQSTAILIIFSCASLLGCSGAGQKAAHPRAVAHKDYGPVRVPGRASGPTDIAVGGIEITSPVKEINFNFGPHGSGSVVISYSDWNTITGTSDVPTDVGLMLDPGYNANDTIRQRFQYLADRISLFGLTAFNVIGVDSSPAYGKYMATVAIFNPTDQVTQISNLRIKISSQSPNVVIASRAFYNVSHGGCIVPAHTIYFAYLAFAKTAAASSGISYDFSYDTITCPGQVCRAGTPIPLCQE
jgi:hypothetical protein